MSIKGVEFRSHDFPIANDNDLSFPEIEEGIYQECHNKKEELKKTLLADAESLANEKTYSEPQSYGQAMRMLINKCNTVESDLLANAKQDRTKISITNAAWQETQDELFSSFLDTLMNILQRQSSKL